MKNSFAVLAAAFALSAAVASPASAQDVNLPSGDYVMDKNHATLTWQVTHMGLSRYVARIDEFDIELSLDTANLANSKVSAVIDPTSIDTDYSGDGDFNKEISSEAKFLNSGEHPEITFVSKSVEPTGDKTAKITGDLTMLGVTKEIILDAELIGALEEHPFAKKAAVGFQAVAVVDRTEFGMDFLAPEIVSPEVTVTINAEFLAK